MIYIGNNIREIYIGTQSIYEVYAGSDLVWRKYIKLNPPTNLASSWGTDNKLTITWVDTNHP